MHRCLVLLAATSIFVSGCGSSSSSSSSGSSASGAGALSAEAKSAATGDIPDNQVFLTYRSRVPGYSISYPEGWTQKGAGTNVSFSDKNNVVHIVVSPAGSPTPASVAGELSRLKRLTPSLSFKPPTPVRLRNETAIKAVYTTSSTPDPVTGKRVKLIVDRYELARSGRVATVDLGTQQGVDNVDAYRMMIESFRWR